MKLFHHKQQKQEQQEEKPKQWIRGVNIGGWLVFERYITPYFFALSDCHLRGDFRYFPNQIDAPPTSSPEFKSMLNPDGTRDESCHYVKHFPEDVWQMTELFDSPKIAGSYFDHHYEHFLKREDVAFLKKHGVTHFRVPLPHWILGNIEGDEPYVAGNAWAYFARLVEWAREEGIQLWPDLHTAPGSQNGFDNSGHLFGDTGKFLTCAGWMNYDDDPNPKTHKHPASTKDYSPNKAGDIRTLPPNVRRTLVIIDEITARMKEDGMDDVVTGFGMLNEPAGDCDHVDLLRFYDAGLDIVRKNLGQDAHVYLGDTFFPDRFNDYWFESPKFDNTYLDTHTYHSFEPHARALSPREQIALVCERDRKAAQSCCYHNNKPSEGIGRIFTEWSGAFDQAVGEKVVNTMNYIRWNNRSLVYNEEINDEGVNPLNQMSQKRQDFMRDFVTAQIVNYESASKESSGWFFWNFKMEGSYFPEWDMMRGLREGWFPSIPAPHVNSIDLYGACYDIMKATVDDSEGVLEIFPPSPKNLDEMKNPITDDVVVTDGEWMEKDADGVWQNTNPKFIARWKAYGDYMAKIEKARKAKGRTEMYVLAYLFAILLVFVSLRKRSRGTPRSGYKVIGDDDSNVTDETTDARISTVSLAELGKSTTTTSTSIVM